MAEEETKGFFESLFSFGDDDKSPREREMVMSPDPPKPTVDRADFPDGSSGTLEYKMRVRKVEQEWKQLMRDREDNPQNYMVPAAHAEADPTKEHAAYTREQDIEETMREMGQ